MEVIPRKEKKLSSSDMPVLKTGQAAIIANGRKIRSTHEIRGLPEHEHELLLRPYLFDSRQYLFSTQEIILGDFHSYSFLRL